MPTMTPFFRIRPPECGRLLASGMLAVAGMWPALLPAASIPEPDTVLYGRIVNRSGPVEHLVTAGTLTWKFQTPTGGLRTYSAVLESLQDGRFSYQLRLPHSLIGIGLQSAPQSLPLPIDEVIYAFGDILVNGAQAAVNPEHAQALMVKQANRAQAVRVDLDLRTAMPDTDGDGMPDWWELAHNLDSLSAADAALDADGDGLSNLAEWRTGLSPQEDNRSPSLAWTELSVYPTGTSGLAVRIIDTNTAPADIVLVVTRTPEAGELAVRREAGVRVLQRGDLFSALEAHEGRLLFRRTETAEPAGAVVPFGVALVDDPATRSLISAAGWVLTDAFLEGANGTVVPQQEIGMRFVREAVEEGSAAPWQSIADSATVLSGLSETSGMRAKAALSASRGQAVVWDVVDHYVGQAIHPRFGDAEASGNNPVAQARRSLEPPQFLLGGSGDDELTGGGGPDVLYGGTGDDVLTGNLGSDRFVIGTGGGTARIEDFRPDEGDQVDLTRLFAGKSGHADEYIRFVAAAGLPSSLHVYATPLKSGEPVAVVEFVSYEVTPESFPHLADRGALLLGDIMAMPLLSITGVEEASENGLRPARFLVQRAGSTSAALSVRLSFDGSATAGVDYQPHASTLLFPPGQASLEILLRPYTDGLSETDEVIRVGILEDPGYRVSSIAGAAELAIRDLLPEFHLTTIRPEAVFTPRSTAQLRIRRDGLIDRQVVLELSWIGAGALTWVDPLPEFLEFGRGETTRLIELRPRTGEARPPQALPLTLRLVPDTSYLLGASAAARVSIVPNTLTFSEWANSSFPGTTDVAALASRDPDGRGIKILERFAFGLVPSRPDSGATSLPKIVERQGRLGVEFVIRPGAREMGVAVELSDNMNQWSAAAGVVGEVFPAIGDALPAGWRRFESRTAGSGPQYFRVRLTHGH